MSVIAATEASVSNVMATMLSQRRRRMSKDLRVAVSWAPKVPRRRHDTASPHGLDGPRPPSGDDPKALRQLPAPAAIVAESRLTNRSANGIIGSCVFVALAAQRPDLRRHRH